MALVVVAATFGDVARLDAKINGAVQAYPSRRGIVDAHIDRVSVGLRRGHDFQAEIGAAGVKTDQQSVGGVGGSRVANGIVSLPLKGIRRIAPGGVVICADGVAEGDDHFAVVFEDDRDIVTQDIGFG